MSRPALVRLSSALPLLALLACNLGKDDEQSSRALPTPEPASTTPSKPPAEVQQLRDPRVKTQAPSRPKEPDSPRPSSPAPAATETTAPTATATAAGDAGASTPPADAGAAAGGADKLNQCIAKCQASLSGCLAKPVALDAGIPSLESMQECRNAFEDCRKACS